MPSIFCKIISREIPAHIVAENDDYLAFLDINPLVEGHCLVIPKTEVDYIYDLSDDVLAGLHLFAKKVALGLKKAIPCERIGMSVIGLEVPHAHVHLIPMNTMDDMNFARPKLRLSTNELATTAATIKSAIEI
ncbi:HIT family protein [Reichenbachiella carrageenanivorans]|uniref:HIT family protein n=1 Tax=Reichenbachiella carrageenanivorans TaxID=2979869 RepID=A0ABY6CUN4_9BACT|nr:HIT family protein [Reichenbachiella carrageenanivorans]UXX77636.1 HIT family protein [Reichenbachiella carrageenanivorans]